MTDLVDLDSIRDAARRIAGIAVRTPLLESPWPDLWLKPETLQPMGAFKIRGAVTAIARLTAAERARGILAHSSGNHAQAVAYAARRLGIDAHIVIPDNAPRPQDRRHPRVRRDRRAGPADRAVQPARTSCSATPARR